MDKCFLCGHEEIDEFIGKEIIIFQCKLCSFKCGKYNVKE